MAEPADSALVTATILLNDNRAVVCGKTATGYRVAVLPTIPNALAFTAKKADGGAAAGTPVVADTVKAAHLGSADVEEVVVPVEVATTVATSGGVTSKYARRQQFRTTAGNAAASGTPTSKWCYTDVRGAPLLANGTAAATVAAAADANVVALSAPGLAASNLTQPGPVPGVYEVTERQQGYVKSIAWTVQKGY